MYTPEIQLIATYCDLLRARLARAAARPDAHVPSGDTSSTESAEAENRSAALLTELDDTLPLAELSATFGLDAIERDILLFAASTRLDPTLCTSIAAACDPLPVDWACPLAWLRMRAVDDYRRFWVDQYRFLDDQTLVESGLIELVPKPGYEGAERLRTELYVPDDVVALLRGERALDPRTQPFVRRDDGRTPCDSPSVPELVLERVRHLISGHFARLHVPRPAPPALVANLIAALGGRGVGKTQSILHVAQRLGVPVLVLDGQALATQSSHRIHGCVHHALREAALHHEVLLIDRADTLLAAGSAGAAALLAAAARYPALVFSTSRGLENADPLLRDSIGIRVGFPAPSFETSIEGWSTALERWGFDGIDPRRVASRFPLDGRQVQNSARFATLVLQGATDRAPGDLEVETQQGMLSAAAMSQLDDNMGNLGIADTGNAGLKDLILPRDVRVQVAEIVSAFRHWHTLYNDWGFGERIHRGRGLICLFDGDPGTGKTMSAEVLANELELKLVRVNTGQVIDKYIGETEKRLGEIFDRAHPGMNLLLFDEADSLFGKRTKVERSTDRYANAAINVLLQLVEHYEGLVVLTTNLKQGIDPAFERRFTYKVRFEVPGSKERARIWSRFIPEGAPTSDDIDFKYLGKELELTGGGIKTAVIRAAYLALKAGDPLSMEHLLEAGYRELASAGKLVRQDY